MVDATQFEARRIAFDFDMMEYRWEQSLSPGNEQYFYWGSKAAGEQGSRNYMGVKSKAIDAMIAAIAGGDDARGLRRRHPRARPHPAVGVLRRAALLSAGAMGGALDARRPSAAHLAVRLSAGNLVGRRMILDPARQSATPSPTLDDLFRRAGVRRPHAVALVDPPNREHFTDGAPRRLTYAQADRVISGGGCAGYALSICRPTRSLRCNCRTRLRASWRCLASCAPA